MPPSEGVHHRTGLQPRHHRSKDGGNRTAGVSSFPKMVSHLGLRADEIIKCTQQFSQYYCKIGLIQIIRCNECLKEIEGALKLLS